MRVLTSSIAFRTNGSDFLGCSRIGEKGGRIPVLRPARAFRPVVLLVLIAGFFSVYSGRCATSAEDIRAMTAVKEVKVEPSFIEQIVAELHGVPIANASIKDLLRAVRKVVSRHRKEAAAILADVLAVERPDMQEIAGQLVAAAIQGLGKEATAVEVEDLVRVAIDLQPKALLPIVHCAAEAVSTCDLVASIVDTASEKRPASDGKNVVALEGKDVVPLDGKAVVAPSSTPVAVSDGKTNISPDGKAVVTTQPVEVASVTDDMVSQIAQTAFDARPDCNPKGLPPPPNPGSTPPDPRPPDNPKKQIVPGNPTPPPPSL